MRHRFEAASAQDLVHESHTNRMKACLEGYDNKYLKEMYDAYEILRDEAIPYEIEQALIRSRGLALISDDYLFSASSYLVSLGRDAWHRARLDVNAIPTVFDWKHELPISDAISSHFSDQGLDVDSFDGI